MSRSADLAAENEKLSSACQTLGQVITRLTESMEAAVIEMRQNGPAAAMEWILNSVSDVSDRDPAEQWDGLETATEWLDRVQDARRNDREDTTKETPNA